VQGVGAPEAKHPKVPLFINLTKCTLLVYLSLKKAVYIAPH
jgi:hypothetical protein